MPGDAWARRSHGRRLRSRRSTALGKERSSPGGARRRDGDDGEAAMSGASSSPRKSSPETRAAAVLLGHGRRRGFAAKTNAPLCQFGAHG